MPKRSLVIAIVALALAGCGGGEKAPAVGGTEPSLEAVEGVPSGSILFRAAPGYSSNLYVVNGDGSGLTQLTDGPEVDAPGAWSPDGKLLAFNVFLRDNGKTDGVYVTSPDGTNQRRITEAGEPDWFISWGPKGKILFLRGILGPAEYWIVGVDGNDPVRILENNVCPYHPEWSPDGQSLITCQCSDSPPAPRTCDVFIIDDQGRTVRSILEKDPRMLSAPKWSPDGSHILLLSQKPSGGVDGLFVMNADGSDLRSLYQPLPDVERSPPVWSPDGSQVTLGTGDEVVAISLQDGSRRTIAKGNNIGHPVWSPDGSRLAFISEHEGQAQLYVVGADGGEPVSVSGGAVSYQEAAWSPDGKRLLFAADRTREGGVYWAAPDGSERGRLDELSKVWSPSATPTVMLTGACRQGSEENSCLSPDGKMEAVVEPHSAGENHFLTIWDVESRDAKAIQVDESDLWPWSPAWSPDGRMVALYGSKDGKSGLYVVDVEREEAREVVVGAGAIGPYTVVWSPDGSYLYYAKGAVCREGCAPGFLYRVRPDGTGEERIVDMRVDAIFGFAP